MDKDMTDVVMIEAIKRAKGIMKVSPFMDKDRTKVLQIEHEAEEKGLMGLGRVTNSGVREVLNCSAVYVALTDMEFNWGDHPSLVLKKGQEIVGEEVRDKETIARLACQKNVWFMHENFVIYKDKCSFPQDIMKQACHFDIPCIPAEWCVVRDNAFQCHSIVYANPCAPCDTYLKERYFSGLDEKGFGTIFIGVKLEGI